jgi:hypothetical protein
MQVRHGVSTMQETRSNASTMVTAHGEVDLDTAPRLDLELAAAVTTRRLTLEP